MRGAAPKSQLSPAILAAAKTLRVDVVTGEVVRALTRDGIEPILLKGPSFASWLYDEGELRKYGDTDLLVAERDVEAVEAVLTGLGFGFGRDGGRRDPSLPQDLHWVRGEDEVDVHATLPGAHAGAACQWRVLSRDTEATTVSGVSVQTLSEPARALHLAVHAAHHGRRAERPLVDLSRGLARVPSEVWREAAALAFEIDAAVTFAIGLRQTADGKALADSLGLPDELPIEDALRADTAPPIALGLSRLLQTDGARAKAALALRELFPSVEFMRVWMPTRRLGALGLVLGYLWRPVSLAAASPRALYALLRASRAAR